MDKSFFRTCTLFMPLYFIYIISWDPKLIDFFNFYLACVFPFSAPTGPPIILRIDIVNSTALNVSWKPPRIQDRHGIVRNYYLFHANRNCLHPPTITTRAISISTSPEYMKTEGYLSRKRRSKPCNFPARKIDGKTTSFVLINLDEYTSYSVYVVCFTVGNSSNSPVKVQTTDQDSKCALKFNDSQWFCHTSASSLDFILLSSLINFLSYSSGEDFSVMGSLPILWFYDM